MVQDLLMEIHQQRKMSEVKVSPKETERSNKKPYTVDEESEVESKVKKDFETVFVALVKVLNDHDVDARTAIHLAQDIITNATIALVADI